MKMTKGGGPKLVKLNGFDGWVEVFVWERNVILDGHYTPDELRKIADITEKVLRNHPDPDEKEPRIEVEVP